MKYVTLDPYYNNQFYNEAKEALKNNKIDFKEFISIKPPFNFYFGLDDSLSPLMVNYDEANKSDEKWLINKVIPVRAVDEYILLRRESDSSANSIKKFIYNEPLKFAAKSNYACFFNIKSRNQVIEISKLYPFKIWYLGKYYYNRYKIGLALEDIIKNFVPEEDILLEKNDGEFNEIGRFEAALNYRVFLQKERLIKYSMTPYIENGQYFKTQYKTYPELV